MKPNLVIQFAKWPQIGRVKTRLASTIGDEAALEAHIQLFNTVRENLKASNMENEVWFDQVPTSTKSNKLVSMPDLLPHSDFCIQCEGDLGRKMSQAIMGRLNDYRIVILVGSDCPTVDQAYISRAIELLEKDDVVLGPAEDGGFVLIACRVFDTRLFDRVAWGGSQVLSTVLKNANSSGIKVGLLPTTWDVDDYDDYLRWKRANQFASNTEGSH